MEDAKEFAEKEGLFFLETSALNSFNTLLTEIFNTVNKKNLATSENLGDSNKAGSMAGKKIVIPSPAQESPTKTTCCSS